MEKPIDMAREMLEFVKTIPASAGLGWALDMDYLTFFEAERIVSMRQILLSQGFRPDQSFEVLDVGYLHGLVPEFLHREFPLAKFTVIDHPDSPNFSNREYQQLIATRKYLNLIPLDIKNVGTLTKRFRLIVLGEIIEHLDPTVAVESVRAMQPMLEPGGRILITTPNANGLANLYDQLRGRDAAHPVVPSKEMNWPHIHLWSPTLLERTLAHYGLRMTEVRFNNGFEAQKHAAMNRTLARIVQQIPQRIIWRLSQSIPRLRGYFVSTFAAANR